MSTKKFQGAFTALITPFTAEGRIDWRALELNIAFQIRNGIHGLVPCGTTGESPALPWSDHRVLMQRTHALIDNKILTIAGTGSNSTEEALQASREAAAVGFDGILLIEPYYNKPASAQIRLFYHHIIANEVAEINPDMTVIPYIIPGRTCCKMEPVDLALLAEACFNVRAVKEATGDLNNMTLTRQLLGPNFSILSGDDSLTATMMNPTNGNQIHGNGVISVISNIAPGAISQMVNLFLDGRSDSALTIADQLMPLFNLVGVSVETTRTYHDQTYTVTDKFPNPGPIKTMMAGLGMDSGVFRPPLGLMAAPAVLKIREVLRRIWVDNAWILGPIEEHYRINVHRRLENDAIWERLSL